MQNTLFRCNIIILSLGRINATHISVDVALGKGKKVWGKNLFLLLLYRDVVSSGGKKGWLGSIKNLQSGCP